MSDQGETLQKNFSDTAKYTELDIIMFHKVLHDSYQCKKYIQNPYT